MRRALPLLSVVAAAIGLSTCAYFNALYNAQRIFGEAEASARRGETLTADGRYRDAIEKAAKSFRTDRDGRWADDALFLIGRAHFEREAYGEARGALSRAMELTDDDGLRNGARAFLGATDVRTGDVARGLARLDSAIAALDEGELRARAHLWRARARFTRGDEEGAFADLDRAARGPVRAAVSAELDRLRRAFAVRDSVRARAAAAHLISLYDARFWADSVRRTLESGAEEWGPRPVYATLAGAEESPWPPRERYELLLLRARLGWRVGDTAAAVADAGTVADEGVGRVASRARVLRARWRLGSVSSLEELEEVRGTLLGAIADREARNLLETIKKVGILVERARSGGQDLALFVAAEMARDVLGAPELARDLFLVYARGDRSTPWEGKALLAALELTDDPGLRSEIEERLRAKPENVYVQMAFPSTDGGADADRAFMLVERRLETVLEGIRAQADLAAKKEDVAVQRAAAQLDSLRRRQLTDSLLALESVPDSVRNRCLSLDSLLTRADTTRGDAMLNECLRGDTLALDSLRVDSLRLFCLRLDSVSVETEAVDSLVARCLRGDTLAADSLRPDSLRREGLSLDSLFRRLPPDTAGGGPPDTLSGAGPLLR